MKIFLTVTYIICFIGGIILGVIKEAQDGYPFSPAVAWIYFTGFFALYGLTVLFQWLK